MLNTRERATLLSVNSAALPRNVADTAWQAASFQENRAAQLLFGTTYEDSGIELQAFAGRERVFCIAAAGDTARVLAAAGHRVTAVDVNPLQVAYAESRAAGAPPQAGAAERRMERARPWLPLVGWSRGKLESFLDMANPAAQLAYWDRHFDTWRWRAAGDLLLSARMLRSVYAGSFVDALPKGFGERLRARLRRGWARHPNRGNPFVRSLLLGIPQPEPGPAVCQIRFICTDAADYLERCSPGSFDGFSLSNIGDGASTAYRSRLQDAVRHAASRGAVVVTRSFAESACHSECDGAVHDRSLLWGEVLVRPIGGI
jgi:hypothetical protein